MLDLTTTWQANAHTFFTFQKVPLSAVCHESLSKYTLSFVTSVKQKYEQRLISIRLTQYLVS